MGSEMCIRDSLGASANILTVVSSSIWSEFIIPCFDVEGGKRLEEDLSNEVRLFAACLNTSSNISLKRRARAQHEQDVARISAKSEAKNRLYCQLRTFFTVLIAEAVWSPLAIQFGLLPAGIQGFSAKR